MFKIIFYFLQIVLAIILPIALIKFIKNKEGGQNRSVRNGVYIYCLFTALLYTVVSSFLFTYTQLHQILSPDSYGTEVGPFEALADLIILCLCSILGRFIWIKKVVKKNTSKGDALLIGTGYGYSFMLFKFGITSVANFVFAILLNSKAQISPSVLSIFASNINSVERDTPFEIFIQLVVTALLFVLEMALTVIIYRVCLCNDRKIWAATGIFAYMVGMTFYSVDFGLKVANYKLYTYISYGIFFFCVLTVCGIEFSLLYPKKKKIEE